VQFGDRAHDRESESDAVFGAGVLWDRFARAEDYQASSGSQAQM
jgi:hypothetical protein